MRVLGKIAEYVTWIQGEWNHGYASVGQDSRVRHLDTGRVEPRICE
jgi:hypothetical protein